MLATLFLYFQNLIAASESKSNKLTYRNKQTHGNE